MPGPTQLSNTVLALTNALLVLIHSPLSRPPQAPIQTVVQEPRVAYPASHCDLAPLADQLKSCWATQSSDKESLTELQAAQSVLADKLSWWRYFAVLLSLSIVGLLIVCYRLLCRKPESAPIPTQTVLIDLKEDFQPSAPVLTDFSAKVPLTDNRPLAATPSSRKAASSSVSTVSDIGSSISRK